MTALPFTDLAALAMHLRQELQNKKFILLYGYNGTGKTRLSTQFKNIGKNGDERDTLYFNAYTEDLFVWDNDLEGDRHHILKLNHKSRFFRGLASMEMDTRVRRLLDRYADFSFRIDAETDKDEELTKAEIIFFRDGQKEEISEDEGEGEGEGEEKNRLGIKISRGEENIFKWCFFLAILQLTLDGAEDYKWVKYIYIDDPISSLDEHNAIVVGNHLIQIYGDARQHVSTVISTHHTLFFNVLHYEIKNHIGKLSQHMLKRDRQAGMETYLLEGQKGDTPQFYHVSALSELYKLAKEEKVSTYHFNVLRSILEKTAFFHGYGHFANCLKKDPADAEEVLHQRFIDILSHGKYSMYEPVEMQEQTRDYFREILRGFLERFPFNPALFPAELGPAAVPIVAPTTETPPSAETSSPAPTP